jgi:FkbM family methyltransferase
MGIGTQSPLWRRVLFRLFANTYLHRTCRTGDGVFEAFVSPGSSLKVLDIRKSLVDPVHARFIRNWVKADAVVWDIGGNLGLFALPAALRATGGQVYVIEPDVELAANLCRTLRLRKNRALKVSVVCLGVSSTAGLASFQISKFSRAMNKLVGVGTWNKVIAEETRAVPVMSIDSLVNSLRPPDVLKIDVEGAEMDVLNGGEATISRFRPVILIEGPSELWTPMYVFFEKHGYALLDGEADLLTPLARPVWNTVAVPKEALTA